MRLNMTVGNVTNYRQNDDLPYLYSSNSELSQEEKDVKPLKNDATENLDLNTDVVYRKDMMTSIDKDEVIDKMLVSMKRTEDIEELRELKSEICSGEIYAYSIRDGKVHVSGGKGYEHKAQAYERLINSTLNSSWSYLFQGEKVSEMQLLDKIDELFKYYSKLDQDYKKIDKNDSIENHLVDAFDKWKEEHLPVKSHFDFRA